MAQQLYCSYRGLEFSSQQPPGGAHDHLQFLESDAPFWPPQDCMQIGPRLARQTNPVSREEETNGII